jgi:heme/copper-type cytochrome/quinol oxidase subunit 2
VYTAATVVFIGFLAILAGVIFQRLRQSLQDHRDLKARLERNGRRVRREVAWTAVTALVVWVTYEVAEHGGFK